MNEIQRIENRFPVRTGWRKVLSGGLPGVLVLMLAMLPQGAAGQERYELNESGWQQQTAYDPASPEGQLQAIRRALAGEEAKRAHELADLWIEAHPNHALMPEARILRGDALIGRERYYESLYDYEYVIRVYPASAQFHTALEREYEVARLFTQGAKRRFLGMRILSAKAEGEELLIRIQERAPGSELGERASLTLADYYYDAGEMVNAAVAYDLFLENYRDSGQREWAMLRLIDANLARFQGPSFDATGLIEAGQWLRSYQREYPAAAERLGAEARLAWIDESLAEKNLRTAQWYERRAEQVSAAYLYQRVVSDYPQSTAARKAIARLERLNPTVRSAAPALDAGPIDAPAPSTEGM